MREKIQTQAEAPAIVLPWQTDLFQEKWKEWKQYRSQIRKPLKTDKIEQRQLLHLQKLSHDDQDTAIAILDKSMANTWTGIFELTNNKKDASKKQTTNPFWRNA